MATIYLQRHTRPDVELGICYGISDLALHEQFEAEDLPVVLQRLDGVEFEKVCSSPLQRCKILAECISDDIHVDNRLMELNFGDWEMKSWEEIEKTTEGQEWFADYLNCSTPNGESFQDLKSRAASFLNDIRNLDGNILVVSHSGFMRAVMVMEGLVEESEAFSANVEYGDLFILSGNKIERIEDNE